MFWNDINDSNALKGKNYRQLEWSCRYNCSNNNATPNSQRQVEAGCWDVIATGYQGTKERRAPKTSYLPANWMLREKKRMFHTMKVEGKHSLLRWSMLYFCFLGGAFVVRDLVEAVRGDFCIEQRGPTLLTLVRVEDLLQQGCCWLRACTGTRRVVPSESTTCPLDRRGEWSALKWLWRENSWNTHWFRVNINHMWNPLTRGVCVNGSAENKSHRATLHLSLIGPHKSG